MIKEIIGYNISDIIPNINKEIGYNKELHIEDTIALVNKNTYNGRRNFCKG